MAVRSAGSPSSEDVPATEEKSGTQGSVHAVFSKIPPIVWAVLGFAAITAVVFRSGIVSEGGSLPQGTNALNAYVQFAFLRHFPNSTWAYPLTDWGQPNPWFTGPSILTPAFLTIGPATLIRVLEATAWFLAGLSMYIVARKLGSSPLGAGTAGIYYAMMANVSQYFEGHVSTMISIALLPVAFWFAYRLFDAPTLWAAVGAATMVYLLASIGDLSILYMFLFFGIPMVAYTIAKRWRRDHYQRREILCVLAACGLFVLLMFSWAYPYFLGARPEYTTGITVGVLPFDRVTGLHPQFAFLGFLSEDSFVSLTYGVHSYAIGGALLTSPPSFLYLLIPIGILAYVVLWPSRDRVILYLGALAAMLISTGALVPGLSWINLELYNYVPYFDSNPTLERWAVITLLAYSILLALGISQIERWIRAEETEGSPILGRLFRVVRRRTGPVVDSGPPDRRRGPRRRPWALVLVVSVVLVLTISENSLVVSQPPTFYQTPAGYTAGTSYIADQPVRGGTLAVPFGSIYEITPWAGTSGSSSLLVPSYTGSDVEMFEAGTPYSLALDQFIGDGITNDRSSNMTKFLAATNTEFILATKYPNWQYATSGLYPPIESYYSLFNQSGLGSPAFQGGFQTVFQLSDYAGNISFDPTYFVYFLNSSQLYVAVNSSWYTGPSDALVDGTTVGSALPQYVAHASGVIVPKHPPSDLDDVLSLAQMDKVPIFSPDGSSVAGEPSNVTIPPSARSYRDLADMPDPADVSYTSPTTGWGLLVLAQTYSFLWNLEGAGWNARAVVNVGLNAWLVNATNGSVWTIQYQGSVWLTQSLYVEATGWGILAVVAVTFVVRRRQRLQAVGREQGAL